MAPPAASGDPQVDLFGDPPAPAPGPQAAPAGGRAPNRLGVEPADPDPAQQLLAQRLGPRIRLGTSSWHFPGWQGLVWRKPYPSSALSRHGLGAYARHPLLRTVSLDRSFYRALDTATFASLAAMVPADFRFVVKAPAAVTDAVLREPGTGRPAAANPGFLDPVALVEAAWRPAAEGLGARLGMLVLQLSPLPVHWLQDREAVLERLDRALAALAAARGPDVQTTVGTDPSSNVVPAPPQVAVEVRDAELLGADLARVLKRHGARYCVGLHDRLPPLEGQLPMLRALWPGPLVVRWNLPRGLRYEAAKARFEPFDRLVAPDEPTRHALAHLIARTAAAGQEVLVTINNKAEGSAPRSVDALARSVVEAMAAGAEGAAVGTSTGGPVGGPAG